MQIEVGESCDVNCLLTKEYLMLMGKGLLFRVTSQQVKLSCFGIKIFGVHFQD
jgi:hypothetical protein